MAPSDRLKLTGRLVLTIEVLFAIGAGAYVRWGLNKPDLSTAVWVGGLFASATTIFLSLKIEATLTREFESIRKILGLLDAYLNAENGSLNEFRARKLEDFVECLDGYKKGEAGLEGEEYYIWLDNNACKGYQSVRAVSMRPESVYTDDVQETNWLNKNIDCARSGTSIERIFVSSPSQLIYAQNREPIRVHLETDNMSALVVWRASLAPEILNEIAGGGFSIYDDKLVFWDQSYFRQALVEPSGGSETNLVPVASVFVKPHPKVEKFKSVYSSLRTYVPGNLRGDSQAAYIGILKKVDEYLTREYGSFEGFVARVDHNSKEFGIVSEWRNLKEEIADLQRRLLSKMDS